MIKSVTLRLSVAREDNSSQPLVMVGEFGFVSVPFSVLLSGYLNETDIVFSNSDPEEKAVSHIVIANEKTGNTICFQPLPSGPTVIGAMDKLTIAKHALKIPVSSLFSKEHKERLSS